MWFVYFGFFEDYTLQQWYKWLTSEQTSGFRVRGKSWWSNFPRESGDVCVCVFFFPCMDPRELALLADSFPGFLQYKLNVTYSPACMLVVYFAL